MLQRNIIGAIGMALIVGMAAVKPAAAATLDTGNTAWMLTSTGLVLFMTLPGLALFYGGLVQSRNVLSVLMHCFAVACLVSVLWAVIGYTLVFRGADTPWIGTAAAAFLRDLAPVKSPGNFPESVFVMYQMTFAIITPALIVGTFPERISFPFVLGFTALWLLLVYVPVAHWVWGGGWLAARGIVDFAGGIVVHTTAGVSALVAALMVGPRHGFPNHVPPPHNPGLTMAGAAMLWVGWFGFNAGSALAADASAGNAMLATHLAAAAGALTWMVIEWTRFGKPSSIGLVTGMVAGLATITPASGYTGPMGAIGIGVAAGTVCFLAVRMVKVRFRVDDSLDVFGVHGVGGMLGSLLVAVTALPALGGAGLAHGMTAGNQFAVQALGVGATALWSAAATWILVKLLAATTGVRVGLDAEREGLDLAAHGERAYDLTQG
jgi:Amt family ammonium transporter